MKKDTWLKIKRAVDTLLEIPKEDRSKKITEICGENSKLRDEIEDHLKSIQVSEHFWTQIESRNQQLFRDFTTSLLPSRFSKHTSLVGTELSSYTLLEEIATGGMATVYLAARSDGSFDRKVAVKVMAHSIHLKETKKHFFQEQQILASLNHPGIAQLYDAGVTESGNPYFIMEFVEGENLISYSRNEQLSLSQKLELFLALCKSIEFAHQNLIVHRDLKPANIFVNNNTETKVFDFGISKLLSDSEKIGHEELLQEKLNLYTLNYAAPEQIRKEKITVATDVYTLGLILFELLSEQKPFDLAGKNRKESEDILLTKTIPKVSSAAKISNYRFSSDLDSIVETATRKEPQKRYASVRQFREDIERFLNKEPVLAMKGDLLYRTQKFIVRNKPRFFAGSAFTLVLILLSVFYIVNINKEKKLAQQEAQRASIIQEYLIDLFESSDPMQNSGDDITIEQYISSSIEKLSELNDQPKTKADLSYTLARIAQNAAETNKAINLFKISYEIEDSLHSTKTLRHANIFLSMGSVLEKSGQHRDAITYFKRTIEIQKSISGLSKDQHFYPLLNLGQAYAHIGDIDSAEIYLNLAKLSLQEEVTSVLKNDINVTLADISREKNDFEKSIELETQIVEFHESQQSIDTVKLSHAYNNLAFSYTELGAYADAEINYKKALELRDAYFDSFTANSSTSLTNLARVLSRQNKKEEANAIRKDNLLRIQNKYGEIHWRTANALDGISKMHWRAGDFEAGLKASNKAIEIYETALGQNHLWTSRAKMSKAIILESLNKSKVANKLFDESLQAIKSDSLESLNYYEIGSFRKMKTKLDTLEFKILAETLDEYLSWYDKKFIK